MSIDKIAKQAGIASSALRYYERCGLIGEGARIGGRRHYPPSVLQRLSVIKVCQGIGFSLSEISDLLDGPRGHNGAWRDMALGRRVEVQRQIRELQDLLGLLDAAIACACSALCECPHMGPDGHLARRPPELLKRLVGRWQQSTAGGPDCRDHVAAKVT
ncbi:MerR family transcriptional regulator [Dactylosporangium sp. CA-092794]|uniref:MerR family transcriptional regulator n=1 Tax=Dactylosporangium sp. CA-092794 TaxID=3239929 RepID=UPI003D8C1329